ncbi:MAG TPA: hypothetical protein VLV78_18005 [Thermoanaerobaculia bacterium]|nr:hypothetical protein [Thermoanaerobaculia bacterium]
MGNILGTSPSNTSNQQLRGTVDSVDLNSRSLYLINVSGYGSMLSSGGSGSGSAVRVYYDNATTVQYQGRTYRPEDLERGDQIDVTVQQSGNTLMAQAVNVVTDVRTTGNTYPTNTSPNNGTYGSIMHGTVRSVDTYRHTISLDTGYGAYATVAYGTSTPVYFNGRTYAATDLQVGDEIDIRVQNPGSTQPVAQDITVTRSISASSGTYGSTATSTVRGTVQSVDTTNRTIQLSQTNWITGFDRSVGNGATITIRYDTTVNVNVQGQLYPVTGLERGDVIEVQLQNPGSSNYVARSITLVHDVSGRL